MLIHLLCEATSYPSPEHDDDDLLGVTCYMLGCARVAVSRSRLSPILHLTQPQPRTLSLVAGSYSPVPHLTSPHLLSYLHLTQPQPCTLSLVVRLYHQCCTSTNLLLHLTSLGSIYAYHLNYLLSYLHLTQPRPHTLSLVVRLYSPPPPPHFTC